VPPASHRRRIRSYSEGMNRPFPGGPTGRPIELQYVSEKSVEKHINSIFSKLHLVDDTESNRRVRSVLLWLAEH
jgi:hypothetical protein